MPEPSQQQQQEQSNTTQTRWGNRYLCFHSKRLKEKWASNRFMILMKYAWRNCWLAWRNGIFETSEWYKTVKPIIWKRHKKLFIFNFDSGLNHFIVYLYSLSDAMAEVMLGDGMVSTGRSWSMMTIIGGRWRQKVTSLMTIYSFKRLQQQQQTIWMECCECGAELRSASIAFASSAHKVMLSNPMANLSRPRPAIQFSIVHYSPVFAAMWIQFSFMSISQPNSFVGNFAAWRWWCSHSHSHHIDFIPLHCVMEYGLCWGRYHPWTSELIDCNALG